MDQGTVRVAIAQASPVYLDTRGSAEKACRLIAEAGAGGARLVAFPEGFIPGHPLWYHFHAATGPKSRQLATRLHQQAPVIPGDITDLIGSAARAAGCYVVIGVCERASEHAGTLYNSQVTFGPDGRVLNVHRKLTPTVGERLVHAPGDASGLRVTDTEAGRIGGLICGESSNPLSLFSLIAESVQVLVISWPDFPGRAMMPRAERALVAGRGAAFMSKAYVLNAIGIVNEEMRALLRANEDDDRFLADPAQTGGSSVICPDGSVLAGPADEREQLLFADLDLSRCLHEKAVHDYAGHYNRPDIFTLQVDRRRRSLFRPRDAVGAAPGNEQSRHEVGPAEQDSEAAAQVVFVG
jgi:aliphatic nitrilase